MPVHTSCRPLLPALVLIALCMLSPGVAANDCRNAFALQILGSGGPIADDDRASSGYLLWHDGAAVALIDAGGGIFQRFGEAGASLDSLELIALTHFHTDHAADLPALLKGAYFSDRSHALAIAGPSGNVRFPGLNAYLESLFDADRGAFRYLSGLLTGSGRVFPLTPIEIEYTTRVPVEVLQDPIVHAMGVHHGPVPSLAYRFEISEEIGDEAGDISVVISGDQNLSGQGFIDFAHGADLLVMPFAIPETAGSAARNLHAIPSGIGRAAAQANVGHLVLSHFMARSLEDLDSQLARVREHYDGPITLAEDLQCLRLR